MILKHTRDFKFLTEGTKYDDEAVKILDAAGLWNHDTNTRIIQALYRGIDGGQPDIHAFVRSPNWLMKYLKGIARMLVVYANGSTDRGVQFLNEAPAVFEPVLTWIKTNRNEKNAKGLDNDFVNVYSFDDVKDFLKVIQDSYDQDSKERLKNLDTTKPSNYKLIKISSFNEMSKFGDGVTGDTVRKTSSWCYAYSNSVYESWINDDTNIMFVLARDDYNDIKPVKGNGNPKDDYGLSLIGLRVSVADGSLMNATLRWNHVGVPSNADNQFNSYGELSEVVGFDVGVRVKDFIKEEMATLKAKTNNLHDFYYQKALEVEDISMFFIETKHRHLVEVLTIPDNVKTISERAFLDCHLLSSIEIPNSVTLIGSSAFSGCTSLTSINIPNSVTSIGNYAFSGCSNLTSITIPNSVTSIGAFAFPGCTSLTSITIPNSVTSIGFGVFSYCTSLTSITIPNSVTLIGGSAFSYCTSLTSITIPNSVTLIGDEAFSYCTSLTSITIPNSVTLIGDEAFSGCTSLTSINIPNSVTSIGNYAFSGCSNLTSITIPNSVTSIGYLAFRRCKNLRITTEYKEGTTRIFDFLPERLKATIVYRS